MTFDEARAIVKAFVGQWSDFKIASVLAFAEDGKMDAIDPCRCLIGVASCTNLHSGARCFEPDAHYNTFKQREMGAGYSMNKMHPAERAYYRLASNQPARDREFIAILRSVIAERDQSANAEEHQPVEMAEGSASK